MPDNDDDEWRITDEEWRWMYNAMRDDGDLRCFDEAFWDEDDTAVQPPSATADDPPVQPTTPADTTPTRPTPVPSHVDDDDWWLTGQDWSCLDDGHTLRATTDDAPPTQPTTALTPAAATRSTTVRSNTAYFVLLVVYIHPIVFLI